MDTNEIMANEEVIETTTEEITKMNSGKGFKVAAGIGLSVLAGVLIYQYVAKPVVANIKAKKEIKKAKPILNECDEAFSEEMTEDLEEKS